MKNNHYGVHLQGKYLLLKEELLKPEYRNLDGLVVKAGSGFGCNPNAMGTAIFVEWNDGDTNRYVRSDFQRLATPEEIQHYHKGNAPIEELVRHSAAKDEDVDALINYYTLATEKEILAGDGSFNARHDWNMDFAREKVAEK